MQIRKFRVSNMSEGLAAIRREVGSDAVVLSATKVVSQGGLQELEIAVAVNGRVAELTEATPVATALPTRELNALRDIVTALTEQIGILRSEVRSLRVEQHMRVKSEGARPEPERARQSQGPALGQSLNLALLDANGSEAELARAFSISYQVLVSNGLLESHAEVLLSEAFGCLGAERTPKAFFEALEQAITRRLEVASPLWNARTTQRQVVVMLGPTGVGKTTTVAKIAGKARFLGGRRVALIGADNFRIGGHFQLESYADLLGVPLLRATTPVELRSALDELRDFDLVLVDTAGRNPWSETADKGLEDAQFAALRGGDDEVILTLCVSAATRTADLVEMAQRYEVLAPDALIVTKLDEARGLGSLYSVSIASGLPLSHVCTGQVVPDDIENPSPRELAAWVRRGHHSAATPEGQSESEPVAATPTKRRSNVARAEDAPSDDEALYRR